MPSQPVQVDPNGGPLSVVMTCGQANNGNYNLIVIEKDRIDIVQQFPITEFSTPPATHAVAGAASDHQGRFVRSFSSVGLLGSPKLFSVSMEIFQGGTRIGELKESGTGSDLTKKVELVAKLVAAAAGLAVPSASPRKVRRSTTGKMRRFAALDAKVESSTRAMLGLPKKKASRKPAKAKPKRAKAGAKARQRTRVKKGGLKK